MATSRGYRIGIFAMVAIMVIGTFGMFAAMILETKNSQQDSRQQQEALEEYQANQAVQQQEIAAETAALSDTYYDEFVRYRDEATAFDLNSVEELKTTDLKDGDGETVGPDTKVAVYYIGWNPDGKIFDSSIDGESLKEPLYRSDLTQGFAGFDRGLQGASVIEGWKEGLEGMKIGGVRIIEIPSDKAYGEQGGGSDIPPNTPIKFVVMAIPPLKDYEDPAGGF